MLVVKTLHLWMVISWFAGLFYLPRISSTWPWCRPTASPSANASC